MLVSQLKLIWLYPWEKPPENARLLVERASGKLGIVDRSTGELVPFEIVPRIDRYSGRLMRPCLRCGQSLGPLTRTAMGPICYREWLAGRFVMWVIDG